MSLVLLLTSCIANPTSKATSEVVAEYVPKPTPADNLPELVKNLLSDEAVVRHVSAHALKKYGKDATIAIPALINNLYYTNSSDVQSSAAEALGDLGPDAQKAVPDLVAILHRDNQNYVVCYYIIEALGKIGSKRAVPALIGILYNEDRISKRLAPTSALSIAQITGEKFVDSDDYGFILNNEGEALLVIDVRTWWEEKGKYLEWESK